MAAKNGDGGRVHRSATAAISPQQAAAEQAATQLAAASASSAKTSSTSTNTGKSNNSFYFFLFQVWDLLRNIFVVCCCCCCCAQCSSPPRRGAPLRVRPDRGGFTPRRRRCCRRCCCYCLYYNAVQLKRYTSCAVVTAYDTSIAHEHEYKEPFRNDAFSTTPSGRERTAEAAALIRIILYTHLSSLCALSCCCCAVTVVVLCRGSKQQAGRCSVIRDWRCVGQMLGAL